MKDLYEFADMTMVSTGGTDGLGAKEYEGFIRYEGEQIKMNDYLYFVDVDQIERFKSFWEDIKK